MATFASPYDDASIPGYAKQEAPPMSFAAGRGFYEMNQRLGK
jgi:hypothetical protein